MIRLVFQKDASGKGVKGTLGSGELDSTEISHEGLLRTKVKTIKGVGQLGWKGREGFETVLRCD